VFGVSAFRSALGAALAPSGIALGRWTGTPRMSDHMLALKTEPQPTVLYVKESNTSPAFWGLTKNQLNRLRACRLPWFVVLLDGGNTHGYLLTPSHLEIRIGDGTFELARDGDHKVNEADLSDQQRFIDLPSLVKRLL
jgi:hypothetical protein